MEKRVQSPKRKGRYFQRIATLLLAVCISVSSLPRTGGTGKTGGGTEAYTGNLGGCLSGESQDIVHGFGSKIKNKKQKEIKVRVNHGNPGNQNGKSWNMQMIQSGKAEETQNSGRRIKVAVIDSGINFSTDLPVAVRKNFIPEEERSVLYEDPSGHGTAVAGVIAALDNDEGITGINPRVELYSARVLDAKLEALAGRIVEAIDWAVEQDVDIINMSFGLAKNVKELEEAVERAAEEGILLVAAAGNGETVAYPAAYDEVIAVGSVTAEGLAAEGSAGGEALELMAPGKNILSSGIFGGVTGMSGTSMAAPHVAGAASVLMELNPDMPADYIRALLNYSANLCGDSDEYGNGVIDLGYAIEINDKFRKLYEKHIDKAEKNEKEKEKQKEKFWGEVLKTIPENEKAVETFTGVEVVEGMWGSAGHSGLGAVVNEMSVSFTSEQMKILTFACNYPDQDAGLKDMDDNPYHGFLWQRQYKERIVNNKKEKYDYKPLYDSNYIANYIFLTKLALKNGEVEGIKKEEANNMLQNDYNRIYEDFKGGKIGATDWSSVFQKVGVPDTNENRRIFIYGIAIHLVGDLFAHSAWAWEEENEKGNIIRDNTRITHKRGADNTSFFPNRYTAAMQVVKNVIGKAYSGSVGTVYDFAIAKSYFGTDKDTRFYLGNFAPYAQAMDTAAYNLWSSFFVYADLKSGTGGVFDFEGDTYFVP